VWVTNVPDFCIEEVSDHAVGLLLAWARGIVALNAETHAGLWRPAAARLQRVASLCCGIIGYGRIGRRIAQKLAPFGPTLFATVSRMRTGDGLAALVPLEDLLRRSQVVIVTAPLTPATRHLLDAARLALLPRGAFVINVSRGGLIDTHALLAALAEGRLAGAGLDVIEGEPEVPAALAADPRVIMTPHIAFSSDAAITDLRRRACAEVVRVLRGERPLEGRNEPDLSARAGG
jgi:D-3-phosphoglycerate dehydrogenase